MHELSLCRSLLRVLEEAAQRQGFRRVHGVVLAVGALAQVDVAALRTGFSLAARGTVAEGAQVHFRREPGCGRCPACGGEGPMETFFDPCPRCGAPLRVIAGEGIRVVELEVA